MSRAEGEEGIGPLWIGTGVVPPSEPAPTRRGPKSWCTATPWASVARPRERSIGQSLAAVQVSVNVPQTEPSLGEICRSMKSNMPLQRPSQVPRCSGSLPGSAIPAMNSGSASSALVGDDDPGVPGARRVVLVVDRGAREGDRDLALVAGGRPSGS